MDAALFDGKGDVQLTGNLGDVMKESARTAISLVKSLAEKYGIDKSRFEKTDIHIHVPEGGNSQGRTFRRRNNGNGGDVGIFQHSRERKSCNDGRNNFAWQSATHRRFA